MEIDFERHKQYQNLIARHKQAEMLSSPITIQFMLTFICTAMYALMLYSYLLMREQHASNSRHIALTLAICNASGSGDRLTHRFQHKPLSNYKITQARKGNSIIRCNVKLCDK